MARWSLSAAVQLGQCCRSAQVPEVDLRGGRWLRRLSIADLPGPGASPCRPCRSVRRATPESCPRSGRYPCWTSAVRIGPGYLPTCSGILKKSSFNRSLCRRDARRPGPRIDSISARCMPEVILAALSCAEWADQRLAQPSIRRGSSRAAVT